MQDRIRWTASEIATIVEGAAQYLYRHGYQPRAQYLCQAVRQAQLGIDTERRRTITGVHTLGRVTTQIEARLGELNAPSIDETPAAPESAAPSVLEASLEQLLLALMPKMVDSIADRVLEKLEAKCMVVVPADMLRKYMPGLSAAPAAPAAPKKPEPKKPTIVVVGLKNDQRHIVERKFAKEVTFKFYGKSLPKNIGSASCDYAIGMVGFLSHPVDGLLVENFQGRYHRLSNGMTQLESKLHELVKRFENTH